MFDIVSKGILSWIIWRQMIILIIRRNIVSSKSLWHTETHTHKTHIHYFPKTPSSKFLGERVKCTRSKVLWGERKRNRCTSTRKRSCQNSETKSSPQYLEWTTPEPRVTTTPTVPHIKEKEKKVKPNPPPHVSPIWGPEEGPKRILV